jgi:tRNA(adenine34) deaminase
MFGESACQVEYTTPLSVARPVRNFVTCLYTGAPEIGQRFKDFKLEYSQILHFMKLALSEARACRQDVPVGAVIVREGEVFSSGFNQREEQQDPLGHAELAAIAGASRKLGNWRLSGCTLFSTLEPCPMCAEAIIQARFDLLVFGAYDPVSGAAGSAFNLFAGRRSVPVPEVIAGILEEECSLLISEFFFKQRMR